MNLLIRHQPYVVMLLPLIIIFVILQKIPVHKVTEIYTLVTTLDIFVPRMLSFCVLTNNKELF